jgi:hypothetical protein
MGALTSPSSIGIFPQRNAPVNAFALSLVRQLGEMAGNGWRIAT